MIDVACAQCGSMNVLSAENCRQCGSELHYVMPSSNSTTFANPSAEYAEDPGSQREEFPHAPFIGTFDGVSAVLNPTITLFKDNFWLISKIVLALYAPLEVFKVMAFNRRDGSWQAPVGAMLLTFFCGVLITPSVIYAVVSVMETGVAPKLSDVYRFGLSKIGTVIVTSIMAGFITVLGFVCLIIPGIILTLALEVLYPVVALENLSAIDSIQRSFRLTKGHRLKIFLLVIVFTLLLGVVNVPISIVAGMLPREGAFVWAPAGAALVSDFFSQVMTVLSLVIYFSILKSQGAQIAQTDLPPRPPVFVES
jgi:hypothetical protein